MKQSKFNPNNTNSSLKNFNNNNTNKSPINNSSINNKNKVESMSTKSLTKVKLKETKSKFNNNKDSKSKKKNINKKKAIKDDIKKNKINEKKKREKIKFNLKLTKKEISKLLNELTQQNIQIKKSSDNILLNNNYNEKKIIKNLSEKQKNLYNDIEKINKQKSYFDEYSFNNLQKKNLFYKNIQFDNIKNLEENKKNILQKLSAINQQIRDFGTPNKNINNNILISNSLYKEDYLEKIKQEKKFREITEKMKILKNQSDLNVKNRMKDIDLNQEKRNMEIDLIEQEENDKKDKELMDKIIKEKKIVEQRKEEMNAKMEMFKPFIKKNIVKGRNNNYLYMKMVTSFEKNEDEYKNKVLKNKTIEEKEIHKELEKKDFSIKKKLEAKENSKTLHKIWKKRECLLPKYISPMYVKVISSEENMKKDEINKLNNKKKLYNIRLKYGKEKVHLPLISNLLRRSEEKKDIKYKITQNKNYKNINNNFKNNIKVIKIKKRNNDNIITSINTLNFSKDKSLAKSFSCTTLISNKTNIYIENKKSEEKNNVENIKSKKLVNKKNKENKIINDNDKNKTLNADIIKGKIEVMEDKYKRGQELLKVKGGYIQNKEFGDKMNNILIDSIKNKLDLIENIFK